MSGSRSKKTSQRLHQHHWLLHQRRRQTAKRTITPRQSHRHQRVWPKCHRRTPRPRRAAGRRSSKASRGRQRTWPWLRWRNGKTQKQKRMELQSNCHWICIWSSSPDAIPAHDDGENLVGFWRRETQGHHDPLFSSLLQERTEMARMAEEVARQTAEMAIRQMACEGQSIKLSLGSQELLEEPEVE